MAREIINTGTAANSGDGEALRSCFTKINNMTLELYNDDAGDVGSIIATAPIEVDQATGDVTVSLADNGIGATKLDVTGNGTAGQVLGSDGDGTFSWQNPGGSINSVVAGDGLTGGGSDQSEVTLTLNVDGTTLETNADAVRIKDLGVTTDKLAADSVTSPKVGNEFTTSSALGSSATENINWTSAQIFTLTPSQSTTLNVTNPVIGVQKTFIITGSGNSYTVALNVGGAAGTFNKISGDYDDTAATKNLYSVLCVSATEFWYSIIQPA